MDYVLHYQDTTVFFTRDGLVLTHTAGSDENVSRDVIRQSFAGASPDTRLTAGGQRAGVVNYYAGNDSSKWLSGIPVYSEVVYEDLYPGIDLVYAEENGRLKREFRISPGADPSRIELIYGGERAPRVDADGVLRFASPAGEMLESPLVCWQVIGGKRVDRVAEYVIDDGSVRIRVAEYDAGYELIIDPVLVYSSYLGGSSGDHGSALAGDGAGGIWVAGYTNSANFPVLDAYQSSSGGGGDAFVSHFSSTGALLSSTYLGGGDTDAAWLRALVDDGAGGVWVTGYTHSVDFPVLEAYQSSSGGGGDAFVSHFSSSGTLLSSTYLGGGGDDQGRALADDGAGGVWVAGITYSDDFPVLNAYQSICGGEYDVFVTHISSTGTPFSSTYLGGGGRDGGSAYEYEYRPALVCDGAGGVWVTGETGSPNFPVMNAYQSSYGGEDYDVFVSHFSSSGTLLSSTYLGGRSTDRVYALVGDGARGVWIAGYTSSDDFPVQNAYRSSRRGDLDAFVSHFSSNGTLLSSTYLGGGRWDYGNVLAGDGAGGVWIAGETWSADFPVLEAYQSSSGGGGDAFVSHFSSSGTLLSSTYLGGGGYDQGRALADDGAGGVWVAGITYSDDFPVLNAYQSICGGEYDVFVTHISSTGTPFSSTYLGGGDTERVDALAGDGAGGVWVAGITYSDDFPVKNAYQSTYGGEGNAFVARISQPRLTVPYIHQVYDTHSGFNGEAACSETAAVMVLAYL
ncbi:MAG: hypothetical protein PHX88_12870, partial [Methanoculleus horonobensis]|nr:hypothetical protein [Methanoculleus horonobensis]